MNVKSIATSAWNGVTNLASKAGKMPKKILLPAVLVTGMTVGGGSVALAGNNKDSFKSDKTEMVTQNKTETASPYTQFLKWISNPKSLAKFEAGTKAETFVMPSTGPTAVLNKNLSSLVTDAFIAARTVTEDAMSKLDTDGSETLSQSEYARESVTIIKNLTDRSVSVEDMKRKKSFQDEFTALDMDKSGDLDYSELQAKFTVLDLADGQKDGKIEYESFMKLPYDSKMAKEKIEISWTAAQIVQNKIDELAMDMFF